MAGIRFREYAPAEVATPSEGGRLFFNSETGALSVKLANGSVEGVGGEGGGITQEDLDAAIAALIGGAPGALNTLDELAAALGDDASYAASIVTALAGKQPLDADLTAIAALSTTAYGRALLALADQAALRTAVGVLTPTAQEDTLDANVALGTTAYGNDLMSLELVAGTYLVLWKVAISPSGQTSVYGVLWDDAETTRYDEDEDTVAVSGWRYSSLKGWTLVTLGSTTTLKVSASRASDAAASALRDGGNSASHTVTRMTAIRLA